MKTIFTLALILASSFAQAADFTITVQSAGGGSEANTNLSNLTSPTAFNQDLLPADVFGANIGSPAKPFAYIHAIGLRNGLNVLMLQLDRASDGLAKESINWNLRKLYSSDSTTDMLDYSTAGALDAKTNKIINVATPVNATDAATKEYVDSASGGSGPIISSEIVQPTCDASNVCTITLTYTPKMVFYIAVKMASNSKLFNFTVSNTVTEISQAQALGVNGVSFVVNEQQKTLTFSPKDAIGTNAVISNGLLQNYTQVRYLH